MRMSEPSPRTTRKRARARPILMAPTRRCCGWRDTAADASAAAQRGEILYCHAAAAGGFAESLRCHAPSCMPPAGWPVEHAGVYVYACVGRRDASMDGCSRSTYAYNAHIRFWWLGLIDRSISSDGIGRARACLCVHGCGLLDLALARVATRAHAATCTICHCRPTNRNASCSRCTRRYYIGGSPSFPCVLHENEGVVQCA